LPRRIAYFFKDVKNMIVYTALRKAYFKILKSLTKRRSVVKRLLWICFHYVVIIATVILTRIKGISFPPRSADWAKSWRWRFEFLTGYAEYPVTLLCRDILRPGMCAVDVGAHVGYYTLLFAELVGNDGKVISMEANTENFGHLKNNVNGFENVFTFNYAVFSKAGKINLHIGDGHSNHSVFGELTKGGKCVSIDAITLDRLLQDEGINDVDLIKVDAEGSELEVLTGMKETLRKNPACKVILEIHPKVLKDAGYSINDVPKCIEGYSIREIREDGQFGQDGIINSKTTRNYLCERQGT